MRSSRQAKAESCVTDCDVEAFVRYCRKNLKLDTMEVYGGEYNHSCVPLCVIDAVFSIGVRYRRVENTLSRFCEFSRVPMNRRRKMPPPEDQWPVSRLLKLYKTHGAKFMMEKVYCNRQRTSTANGITKSEAVLRFAQVLGEFGVEYFQHVKGILGDAEFEAKIMQIPGQRSGISLRYFYMLAGSEDFIKPDRMINRFVEAATSKTFSLDETTRLVVEASKVLSAVRPGLKPRTLDNFIWQYQRGSKG